MRLCGWLFCGWLLSPILFLVHNAKAQPVKMDITLTNTSRSVIVVAQDKSGMGDFTYAIAVRDAEQKEAPRTDYHRALRGESTTTPMIVVSGEMPHSLEPGKSMVDTLEINDFYDLRVPGKYTIQVERVDSASKNPVESNLVRLTITQ